MSRRLHPGILLAAVILGLLPAAARASQLTLGWTDNSSDELGFQIERRSGTATSYGIIATVGANVTSFTDVGITDGITYCYRVAAYNASGSSAPTNEACATAGAGTVTTTSLSVSKDGLGTGTVTGPGIDCGPTCSESVATGTSMTLTAAAAPDSVFSSWSGACSGTGLCTVTISGTTTVTASFAIAMRSLTVTRGGTGSGTVSGSGINCGSDCSETVASGTTLTLTATASPGSTFKGWAGACGGTGGCTVTISTNTVVGATFDATLSPPLTTSLQLVTGAGPQDAPWVFGFGEDGTPTGTEFLAYSGGFTGGVFVTLGRLDGTGVPQVVTGSGPGIPAQVLAYHADGSPTGAGFLPYGGKFKGGVRVATCDVDGDGIDEIVTVPGPGRASTVTVWKVTGTSVTQLLSFYADKRWTGGLYVACGDLDGDGRADVVVARDQGGAPDVLVYRITGTKATLRATFRAYASAFTGGVRVSVVHVTSDGRSEVLTVPGPGTAPTVKIYSIADPSATLLALFPGADASLTSGLYAAGGAWDSVYGGGRVIVAPGPGGPPYVRMFTVSQTLATELAGFYAGDPSSRDGVTVGAIR